VLYYTLWRACVETIEREGLYKPDKQMVKIVRVSVRFEMCQRIGIIREIRQLCLRRKL